MSDKTKIVAASGGFDPCHLGHLQYLKHASKCGTWLVVIINDDDFLIRKKGYAFMPMATRMAIIEEMKCVNEVVACIDKDQTVCETLRMIRPHVFAKGGDRYAGEIPEASVCRELDIEIVDGLGQKIQSSSELVAKIRKPQ